MTIEQKAKGKSKGRWFWGIFLTLIFLGLIFVGVSFLILISTFKSDSLEYQTIGKGDKIGVVEISDVLTLSEDVVEQIKKFREDKSIKAIVVRVNSPGGGVSASQEIYQEIKRTRESGKIIVTSMSSIAASGGYYISLGSNLIVANPGTITGSIGVIIQLVNFKELAEKIGIGQTVIKSGELKDAGNPFERLSEKDKQYLQNIVDNVYQQFLDVVSSERKIDKDKLLPYADGRVFTGLQAKEIGLIDTLGTFEDAIKITAQLAGIEDEPRIVKKRKKFGILERLFDVNLDELTQLRQKIFEEPILQYKYIP